MPSLGPPGPPGAINLAAGPKPPAGWHFTTIDITGKLLGQDNIDDFYLSLFREGRIFATLDSQNDTSPALAPQTRRRFVMSQSDAVPPGKYLVIYRVNGQQAPQGFAVDLS